MEQIAQYWISDAIKPNGAAECGNHVAARWYSGGSGRFLDFMPPPENQYQEFSRDKISYLKRNRNLNHSNIFESDEIIS